MKKPSIYTITIRSFCDTPFGGYVAQAKTLQEVQKKYI